ncbi:hypothetical protein RND71_009901 [Anisodus tanguticus]|uniref:C2H2-type domain-containing protein n=1 Tax=Anisodus tanguticus TaxID=243964 RepID=A0AAE1SIQ6_9SOLA|nr:hypothetical protein RND71_009901 [Anisodus tanguticus]
MTAMKRRREDDLQIEAQAMANCVLMLLSRLNNNISSSSTDQHQNDFECKTCNKWFPSFQALGGHRASHNKRSSLLGEFIVEAKKNKMHKCSICGMELSVGQALGGHMRHHRCTDHRLMYDPYIYDRVVVSGHATLEIFCLGGTEQMYGPYTRPYFE